MREAREARLDPELEEWAVPEEKVAVIKAEKIFGVVVGPSSCGCHPAGFQWVGEKEVRAGKTRSWHCRECTRKERARLDSRLGVFYRHKIIDVCGEPDVAEAVFEAEFRHHFAYLPHDAAGVLPRPQDHQRVERLHPRVSRLIRKGDRER
jgi:hypothetical protein